MKCSRLFKIRRLTALIASALVVSVALGQNSGPSLRGKVTDAQGGLIPNAIVTVIDAAGKEKSTATNTTGQYSVSGLAPGVYTVRVSAPGFAVYENLAQISAGRAAGLDLNIQLSVATVKQEVTVTSETQALELSQENNSTALVLKGADLDALPDDPDDLQDALQALAGPSAGPNGGQFYIDGFEGDALPPKSSIREIRINQNPFSSEFDRLGFGRIEILTKPGTDKLRGSASFNYNNENLNSRNAFALTRSPFEARHIGGNLSGSLVEKKASYFLDFERRDIDENAIISARILDGNLNPTSFSQTVITPQRRTRFSPRFDLQLNDNNTLSVRYNFLQIGQDNQGVGNFSLASRAYNTGMTEHEINITETAVLSPRLINETRFGYEHRANRQQGDNSIAALNVLDSFISGGAQIGNSSNALGRWTLQNSTSWTAGNHSLKVGGRLRAFRLSDFSVSNFGGTFTFGGGVAPLLNDANQPVLDSTGNPVLASIGSLERYRRTLLFRQLGKSPSEIRALGGGATLFSIASGIPETDVNRVDFGGFIQDEWKLRSDFLLSLGLRYEIQNNISDKTNFAPRVSFAWSPGATAKSRPKTVIRGGFGLFYDRFSENLTLQAERLGGTEQQQFVVSNPDFFPTVPGIAALQGTASPQTTYRVAQNLRAPYSMQSALSIERQLPGNFTVSASYIHLRTLHVLSTRNINAPLPGTILANVPGSGVRPLGNVGNIFEYESGGVLNQNQLILGISSRFNRRLTLFGNYTLGKAESSSDGVSTFPANSYDLSGEYGRANFDVRHRFVLGGTIGAPWGISLNPFIIGSSGRPFNITTGRDSNGDTLFSDRPALATDPTKPGVVATRFGVFDPNPAPGQALIPRNFGEGPGFFVVTLRVSRTWGFGAIPERNPSARGAAGMAGGADGHPPAGGWAGGGGPGAGGPPHGPPGRGGRGAFGAGASTDKRYNLTFSVQAQNLLNHTNFGPVTGNLASPIFGLSNSTLGGFGFGGPGGGNQVAGNRRLELQLRLSF